MVIYKLTIANTVEERILDLQEKKRTLAEQAIEGGMRKDAFKLGVKEMLDLFRHGGERLAGDVAGSDNDGEAELRRAASGMEVLVRREKKKPVVSDAYARRW